MSVKWFSTAGKPFRKRRLVREKPVSKNAPRPKYKSPGHTHRLPKLNKPHVDIPFVDSPRQLSKLVIADSPVSHTDFSGDTIVALRDKIAEHGWTVRNIKWVLGDSHPEHDYGWCVKLAGKSGWQNFESFFAEKRLKPTKLRQRDERRGFNEDSIMGVSHAGCMCRVLVTVAAAAGQTWKYQIDTENYVDNPQPIDGSEPGVPVDPEEIETPEFDESVEPVEEGEEEV